MITNHPKMHAVTRLNATLNKFFSLIAWNVPTAAKIAIKPKITINKFMKQALLSTSKIMSEKNIPPLL